MTVTRAADCLTRRLARLDHVTGESPRVSMGPESHSAAFGRHLRGQSRRYDSRGVQGIQRSGHGEHAGGGGWGKVGSEAGAAAAAAAAASGQGRDEEDAVGGSDREGGG